MITVNSNLQDLSSIGYQALYLLKEGYETQVLLSSSWRTGELVIVKINGDADNALNEVEFLGRLSSCPRVNNLVEFRKNFPKKDVYTLVLEYCNGEDVYALSQHARTLHKRLPDTFVWHIFVQLTCLLGDCKKLNVWHRDFHPGNWFLHFPTHDLYTWPSVIIGGDWETARNLDTFQPKRIRSDICRMGDSISAMIRNPVGPPYDEKLVDWIDRCAEGHEKSPPNDPTIEELVGDMIPYAKQQIRTAGAPLFPSWIANYFAELQRRRKSLALDTPVDILKRRTSEADGTHSGVREANGMHPGTREATAVACFIAKAESDLDLGHDPSYPTNFSQYEIRSGYRAVPKLKKLSFIQQRLRERFRMIRAAYLATTIEDGPVRKELKNAESEIAHCEELIEKERSMSQ